MEVVQKNVRFLEFLAFLRWVLPRSRQTGNPVKPAAKPARERETGKPKNGEIVGPADALHLEAFTAAKLRI